MKGAARAVRWPVVGAIVVASVVPAGSTDAAGSVFIRVNQVGYATNAPKQAFLMTTDAMAGASFQVVGAGAVAFTGTVGGDRGAWNARFAHVYPLEFDTLTATGTYSIKVGGATSPAFDVGSGAAIYDRLIANTLAFFHEQHDGRHVDPGLLDRKPSHLNDAHATVYESPDYVNGRLARALVPVGAANVEGGWFDAGDYLKFVHTAAFVEVPLQLALRD